MSHPATDSGTITWPPVHFRNHNVALRAFVPRSATSWSHLGTLISRFCAFDLPRIGNWLEKEDIPKGTLQLDNAANRHLLNEIRRSRFRVAAARRKFVYAGAQWKISTCGGDSGQIPAC